jgi:PPOX class probable F420-dependent enzyme
MSSASFHTSSIADQVVFMGAVLIPNRMSETYPGLDTRTGPVSCAKVAASAMTPDMSELDAFANLVPLDHGLVVVSTIRADGTIQSSVVNAGVLDHPLTARPVVGFVAAGSSHRLTNLRSRPRATIAIRAGWQWAAVEGPVDLIGPDDPRDGVDGERLRVLLREIFTAAGGTHDDWDEYDRVMAKERRVAVFVEPARVYGNS